MGNTESIFVSLTDAFSKMKTSILDFLVGVAVYVIDRIIILLDGLYEAIRNYFTGTKQTLESCRSTAERKAVGKIVGDGVEKMSNEVKQNLQDCDEISPEIKRKMVEQVDQFKVTVKVAVARAA